MFYKKINYPDGDFYIELIKPTIDFTFRINKPEDLWELTHLVDVLNNNNIKPIITIPNLFSAQADKRFKENYSFGYKLIHNFLGNLNANFKVFHPHQEMCVLLNNVEIIDNSRFVKSILHKLSKTSVPDEECKCGDTRWCKRIPGEDKYCKDLGLQWYKDNIKPTNDNLVVLLPDGGAYKWGAKLMDKLDFRGDVIAAAKNRKFIDDKSVLTQQLPDYDFEGKDILIIDDICIYGGTFKGLATMLEERNCGKLYLAVSHITVQNHEKDNVFNYFDRVFTTNSKYDVYYERIDGNSGKEIKNLDIIKMF